MSDQDLAQIARFRSKLEARRNGTVQVQVTEPPIPAPSADDGNLRINMKLDRHRKATIEQAAKEAEAKAAAKAAASGEASKAAADAEAKAKADADAKAAADAEAKGRGARR